MQFFTYLVSKRRRQRFINSILIVVHLITRVKFNFVVHIWKWSIWLFVSVKRTMDNKKNHLSSAPITLFLPFTLNRVASNIAKICAAIELFPIALNDMRNMSWISAELVVQWSVTKLRWNSIVFYFFFLSFGWLNKSQCIYTGSRTLDGHVSSYLSKIDFDALKFVFVGLRHDFTFPINFQIDTDRQRPKLILLVLLIIRFKFICYRNFGSHWLQMFHVPSNYVTLCWLFLFFLSAGHSIGTWLFVLGCARDSSHLSTVIQYCWFSLRLM